MPEHTDEGGELYEFDPTITTTSGEPPGKHEAGMLTVYPVRRGVQVDRPSIVLEIAEGEDASSVSQRLADEINARRARGEQW